MRIPRVGSFRRNSMRPNGGLFGVHRTAIDRIRPAILAAGLCLFASAAAAQETTAEAGGPFTSITGFRGLDWGASVAEVVAARGEPTGRRTLDNGIELIAYRGQLAERPSVVLYGFLEGRGFVKAQEISNLAGGEACIEQVRDVHREINLRYPLISPAEQAKNNSPDAICSAAPAGEAFWHRQWRDDTTGSVITVSVRSGSDKLELTYESKTFIDWAAAGDGPTTPDVEDEGVPTGVLEARP